MDAIGLDLGNGKSSELADYHIHVEYPYSDHESAKAIPAWTEKTTALCGWTAANDNVLWYDGLQRVDCPVCLKIIAVGKAARIGKRRLTNACTQDAEEPHL